MAKRREMTVGLGIAKVELCLDFVNTEGLERNNPPDRLDSLDLFCDWAVRDGLIDESELDGLRAASPGAVEDFLKRARRLREALYRIFAAVSAEQRPEAPDLAILNRQLGEALQHLALDWEGDRFRWDLARATSRLEELLWPIAASAADLLRSERLDRVKECGSETCSWMFLDESRNRSRRWCDMSDCGNRAKARRFYRRHLQAKASG